MVHRGFSQSFYVSLSDIVTFSFRGQLSLFAHAVLRVLSDFLIWVIVCELFRSKFLTIWLRRCLWFSSSPTVYGNGSDFVSADTCALYLRAYILSSARPFVVIPFTSRALPLFQLVALGVHKIFCWPAYTRTSLSTCLLQPLQLLPFQPFTNFGGGV